MRELCGGYAVIFDGKTPSKARRANKNLHAPIWCGKKLVWVGFVNFGYRLKLCNEIMFVKKKNKTQKNLIFDEIN